MGWGNQILTFLYFYKLKSLCGGKSKIEKFLANLISSALKNEEKTLKSI